MIEIGTLEGSNASSCSKVIKSNRTTCDNDKMDFVTIDIETPPGLVNFPAAEQGIYPPPPEISDTGYQTKSHHTQPPPGMQAYGHQAHTKAQGRENQGQTAPTLPQGPRHTPVARQEVLPPTPQQTVNFDPQRRVQAQKEDNALLVKVGVAKPLPVINSQVTENSTEEGPCGDNKEVRSAVSNLEPDPGISVVFDKRWKPCL